MDEIKVTPGAGPPRKPVPGLGEPSRASPTLDLTQRALCSRTTLLALFLPPPRVHYGTFAAWAMSAKAEEMR
jgi:hypothetical protein